MLELYKKYKFWQCKIIEEYLRRVRVEKGVNDFAYQTAHNLPQCWIIAILIRGMLTSGYVNFRNGSYSGFDIKLVKHIRNNVTIQVIAS